MTLPADDAFHRVAHLVLGGLATRHELTVETLDDLTLALDAVFTRYGEGEDDVTVRVNIDDYEIRTEVGAFHDADVADDLARPAGRSLDIHRILSTTCDAVDVSERQGAYWVELTKRVTPADGAA